MPTRPYALARDEGDTYPAGVTFVIKADEHETTNGAAVMELRDTQG